MGEVLKKTTKKWWSTTGGLLEFYSEEREFITIKLDSLISEAEIGNLNIELAKSVTDTFQKIDEELLRLNEILGSGDRV